MEIVVHILGMDTLVSQPVHTAAADRDRRRMEETMQEPTAEELSDMIRTRKELQALQKVRFNLTDAPSGE